MKVRSTAFVAAVLLTVLNAQAQEQSSTVRVGDYVFGVLPGQMMPPGVSSEVRPLPEGRLMIKTFDEGVTTIDEWRGYFSRFSIRPSDEDKFRVVVSGVEFQRTIDNKLDFRLTLSAQAEKSDFLPKSTDQFYRAYAEGLKKLALQELGDLDTKARKAEISRLEQKARQLWEPYEDGDVAFQVQRSKLEAQLDKISEEVEATESLSRNKRARMEALEYGLQLERADLEQRKGKDPLIEQLQKLVELREKEWSTVKERQAAGSASAAETRQAESAVIEAKIRLEERRAQLGVEGSMSEIGRRMLEEVRMLSVDTRELQIRRLLIEEEQQAIKARKVSLERVRADREKVSAQIEKLNWRRFLLQIEDITVATPTAKPPGAGGSK